MLNQFLLLPALTTYQRESLSQNDAMPLLYTKVLAKTDPVVYQAYPFETVSNQQVSHLNVQQCM
jgi:hypothetical protein